MYVEESPNKCRKHITSLIIHLCKTSLTLNATLLKILKGLIKVREYKMEKGGYLIL